MEVAAGIAAASCGQGKGRATSTHLFCPGEVVCVTHRDPPLCAMATMVAEPRCCPQQAMEEFGQVILLFEEVRGMWEGGSTWLVAKAWRRHRQRQKGQALGKEAGNIPLAVQTGKRAG